MSYHPVKDYASCPKLGLKTDGVVMVLHRVEFLEYLWAKHLLPILQHGSSNIPNPAGKDQTT